MQVKAKSAKLSNSDYSALKKQVKAAISVKAVADNIGISRHVLDRVLLKPSASPETIDKINSYLSGVVA